jgi:hypothetical protein
MQHRKLAVVRPRAHCFFPQQAPSIPRAPVLLWLGVNDHPESPAGFHPSEIISQQRRLRGLYSMLFEQLRAVVLDVAYALIGEP